jgi:hypothetical protein
MIYKSRFSFLLLVFIMLTTGARLTYACSCGPKQTVLDGYEWADVVVIARAVSLEKSENNSGYEGIRSAKMVVEKVFKGDLKAGGEIVLAQGGGADCVWTFDEKSIDEQFLFYLKPVGNNSRAWIAITCGRSNVLKYANDDLLYLNKLTDVRGKTRISGTLSFLEDTDLSVKDRKLRIVGAKQTYEVKTDQNGVYEIYDLPPGKYLVESEAPTGWKIDRHYLRYSSAIAGDAEDKSPGKIPIILEDKKHAGLDIHFEIDNAIRGRVYDTNGKLMKGVCLNLIPAQGKEPQYFYEADCTEEAGAFSIEEIPRGSYLLVVNKAGKISSSEPFKTFYYPNVFEREKATVFTIGEGDTFDEINVHVPEMEETITIDGLLLYSDGKPVVNESVEFKPGETKDNIDGEARAKTDSKGRFSIKILKGLKGELYGEMYTYIGEFENCPKLESVIKKTGQDNAELKTPAIEIQAENNLYNLELRYQFPGCKKATYKR